MSGYLLFHNWRGDRTQTCLNQGSFVASNQRESDTGAWLESQGYTVQPSFPTRTWNQKLESSKKHRWVSPSHHIKQLLSPNPPASLSPSPYLPLFLFCAAFLMPDGLSSLFPHAYFILPLRPALADLESQSQRWPNAAAQ